MERSKPSLKTQNSSCGIEITWVLEHTMRLRKVFFESRMIVPDSCNLFYIYFWGFCRGCQACIGDHTNCFGYCRENRCRWWEGACCHRWFCCHAFLSSILSEKTPSNHFEYSVLSGWYPNTLYVTIQISQPAHSVETTSSSSSWQALPQVELGITSLVFRGDEECLERKRRLSGALRIRVFLSIYSLHIEASSSSKARTNNGW